MPLCLPPRGAGRSRREIQRHFFHAQPRGGDDDEMHCPARDPVSAQRAAVQQVPDVAADGLIGRDGVNVQPIEFGDLAQLDARREHEAGRGGPRRVFLRCRDAMGGVRGGAAGIRGTDNNGIGQTRPSLVNLSKWVMQRG